MDGGNVDEAEAFAANYQPLETSSETKPLEDKVLLLHLLSTALCRDLYMLPGLKREGRLSVDLSVAFGPAAVRISTV